MAILLHPDASEPVIIVLGTDPAISEANDPATVVKYSDTGDESLLTVPAEATRLEIVPLGASTRAKVYAILARAGDTEDERLDAQARLKVLTVEHGLRSMSNHPDIKPVIVAGTVRYPRATVDRLGGVTIWDIAQHIERISEVPEVGKGRSSVPSGSATPESQPSPGTASSARPSPSGSGSVETAAAHSKKGSAADANAPTA